LIENHTASYLVFYLHYLHYSFFAAGGRLGDAGEPNVRGMDKV